MMAIVVRGATCSLGESVVDRLLSWDIDVIASEPSHAERNSSLLQFSPVSLKSEGTGFSISFDGSDADIIVGKDLIIHDLLPSRNDRWLVPEVLAWYSGLESPGQPRYWLGVEDAAHGIASILRNERKVTGIHMCGRREWLPEDTKAELTMLLERTGQGQTGEFTAATLFGHSIAGMEAKPIVEGASKRPDLGPIHELLLELTGDGWRPLTPLRTSLMTLIAGLDAEN